MTLALNGCNNNKDNNNAISSSNCGPSCVIMASTQPDSLPAPRVCSGCGQPEGKPRLKTCAKCSTALYCSRDCQTSHWKIHKKECRNPKSNASQQLPETPMLGLWDEKLYKMTTPLSFLRQGPTPEVQFNRPVYFLFSIVGLTCVIGGQDNVRRAT